MTFKLVVTKGIAKGKEFSLEPGDNLIGRWDPDAGSFPEIDLEECDPDAKISRKHAVVRLDGEKLTIEDIGSLNGTFVNRSPRLEPHAPVELKLDDELVLGKTFLKVEKA